MYSLPQKYLVVDSILSLSLSDTSYPERKRRVIVVYLCVCVYVSVCVLLLISDTTRFEATVKQRVERSCYDIPNFMWRFSKNILVAEKSQSKVYRLVAILKFLRFY